MSEHGGMAEMDRTLRASVPDRWKGCTSPVGAVQNYIAELERALVAVAGPDALDRLEELAESAEG